MKSQQQCAKTQRTVSRPSRGAWIEIVIAISTAKRKYVAPLAGRVD